MDVVTFARELIDLESLTGEEGRVGRFLADYLAEAGFRVIEQTVEAERFNLFARVGEPHVTLSSHLDTVPPFIPSSEDDRNLYGRGACDAKGIIAAQVFAAQALLREGVNDIGLLFVVGEEGGSDGARAANTLTNRNRYLINGEPTRNQQAVAGKGALRTVIRTRGRAAHSAYPELGESAIETLLDILQDIRAMNLPTHPQLGRTTCNIGIIEGGNKANIVADSASCELMFRVVTDPLEILKRVSRLVGGRGECMPGTSVPPVFLRSVPLPSQPAPCVVCFASDIPCLTNWGEPLLIGPGSIDQAHTSQEHISKQELREAVGHYKELVRALLGPAKNH